MLCHAMAVSSRWGRTNEPQNEMNQSEALLSRFVDVSKTPVWTRCDARDRVSDFRTIEWHIEAQNTSIKSRESHLEE